MQNNNAVNTESVEEGNFPFNQGNNIKIQEPTPSFNS